MRCRLPAQALFEIDLIEERVRLNLASVLTQTLVSTATQLQNQVGAFVRKVGLLRDLQCRFPMDHLQIINRNTLKHLVLIKGLINTLYCVSAGVLARNGGWPTSIS